MKAKKYYGQNFLNSDTIIHKIVSLFDVNNNDLILEIGPGRGALTKELVKCDATLLCIEIDTDMKKFLDRFESDKCHIIYSDILSLNLKDIISKYTYDRLFVIGNLPYYITSPILEHITRSQIDITKMVFMVQKEVAERFTAKVCSKEYGYMTLFLDYYYETAKKFDVLKDNFNPKPKVDSAVIELTSRQNKCRINETEYFNFLKKAFQFKRKTLKNNLYEYDWNTISKILERKGMSKNARPEEVTQDTFIEIFQRIIE